jgi:hypothetical protein
MMCSISLHEIHVSEIGEFSNRCKMQGTTPEINDINITVSGVEKLLSKLNPTKAAGPDNITPRVLKELAPILCVSACFIIWLVMMCSISLHEIHVSEIGL